MRVTEEGCNAGEGSQPLLSASPGQHRSAERYDAEPRMQYIMFQKLHDILCIYQINILLSSIMLLYQLLEKALTFKVLLSSIFQLNQLSLIANISGFSRCGEVNVNIFLIVFNFQF